MQNGECSCKGWIIPPHVNASVCTIKISLQCVVKVSVEEDIRVQSISEIKLCQQLSILCWPFVTCNSIWSASSHCPLGILATSLSGGWNHSFAVFGHFSFPDLRCRMILLLSRMRLGVEEWGFGEPCYCWNRLCCQICLCLMSRADPMTGNQFETL